MAVDGTGRGTGGLSGSRRPQMLATVIVAGFLGWTAVNWLGSAAGLPAGVALVADLVCLGVLGWALVTLIGIWRVRRDEGR